MCQWFRFVTKFRRSVRGGWLYVSSRFCRIINCVKHKSLQIAFQSFYGFLRFPYVRKQDVLHEINPSRMLEGLSLHWAEPDEYVHVPLVGNTSMSLGTFICIYPCVHACEYHERPIIVLRAFTVHSCASSCNRQDYSSKRNVLNIDHARTTRRIENLKFSIFTPIYPFASQSYSIIVLYWVSCCQHFIAIYEPINSR